MIEETEGMRWYVARTQRARERLAIQHLAFQGFSAFRPMTVRTVRHSAKFIKVPTSLFPGYLFVKFDVSQHGWAAVNGTTGVSSLIMSGNRPSATPKGLVNQLKISFGDRCEGANGPSFAVGDRVQLTVGPFANKLGQLHEVDSAAGRVRVLLEMMGRETLVTTKYAEIQPVTP
jgi:transcriptional antiterminator RfaH